MSLFGVIFNRRNSGKESEMGEATQQTATPPAASGGITLEQVNTAIASALTPIATAMGELTKNQKVIADTIAADKKSAEQSAASASATSAGVTADDVRKIVTESLTAHQQQAAATQQRDAFVAKSLAKLPAVYQAKLGNDPAKWDAEAQSIQAQYEADFKLAGGTAETKGDGQRDGGATAANQPVDYSKVDGFTLLSQATASQTPVNRRAETTTQTTATTAATAEAVK